MANGDLITDKKPIHTTIGVVLAIIALAFGFGLSTAFQQAKISALESMTRDQKIEINGFDNKYVTKELFDATIKRFDESIARFNRIMDRVEGI